MGKNLSNESKVVEVLTAISHSAGAVTGAVVDTDGFENVSFVVHHGAWGTATLASQIIEDSDVVGMTGAATIATMTDRDVNDDPDKIFCTEIVVKNHRRFLRYSGTVGTAAHIMSVTAVLSGARRAEAVPGEGVPGAAGAQFEGSV